MVSEAVKNKVQALNEKAARYAMDWLKEQETGFELKVCKILNDTFNKVVLKAAGFEQSVFGDYQLSGKGPVLDLIKNKVDASVKEWVENSTFEFGGISAKAFKEVEAAYRAKLKDEMIELACQKAIDDAREMFAEINCLNIETLVSHDD